MTTIRFLAFAVRAALVSFTRAGRVELATEEIEVAR